MTYNPPAPQGGIYAQKGSDTGDGTLKDPSLLVRRIKTRFPGAVLAFRDDGWEGRNSRTSFIPEESERYYIIARSPHLTTGTYTPSVTPPKVSEPDGIADEETVRRLLNSAATQHFC